MPGPRYETRAPPTAAPHPDGHAASARGAAPKPERTRNGTPPRGPAGRKPSEGPEVALRDLLGGLRAGDLESVLLTVAMAAEENRMPCADPDEVGRILAFLARLAEHDAALPPPADGAGGGQKPTRDRIDAEGGGAPAR